MNDKKSPQANLGRQRTTYFLLGMIVALSALFVALEWRSEDYLSPDWEGFNRVFIEEELIGFEEIQPEKAPPEVETPPEPQETLRDDLVVVEQITEEIVLPADSVAHPAEEEKEEEPLPPLFSDKEIQEIIYARAEVMPQYPGGYSHLAAFLYNNIEYPSLAIKQRIQGRVWFSFIVNQDGSVSDIKCEQGVYFALDDEAERVLKLMSRWEPGTIDGRPVRVKVYVPVHFRL